MRNNDRKPRSRHHHWWVVVTPIVVVVLLMAAAWCGYTWHRLHHAALPTASAGLVFTVERGESLSRLAQALADRGALEHAWDLRVLAHIEGASSRIQAGEYRTPAGISVEGLLGMLVNGDVLMHPFTIVPGETFKALFAALETNPVFKHDLKGLAPAAVMAQLGHAGERAEGRFFPQTYDFPRGTSDIAVLKRAYAAMKTRLKTAWQGRAPDLVLKTPYQALIVASIVEKETAVPSERPRIAGVFERRLERGMLLGADPTVIYGLGADYHGKLTSADLARDTPYNTYRHRGLPPTPICMPGLAAIEAAVHPSRGTALYFVAKGDGTHVFSDTLAEQERMIRKYQLHEGSSSGSSGP